MTVPKTKTQKKKGLGALFNAEPTDTAVLNAELMQ